MALSLHGVLHNYNVHLNELVSLESANRFAQIAPSKSRISLGLWTLLLITRYGESLIDNVMVAGPLSQRSV